MYFTVPPGRVRPPDPGRNPEAGNTEEEDTAASALLLKHEFLDGGADDGHPGRGAGAHAHHA